MGALSEFERAEARRLLVELAGALAANGTPAHRLETAMTELADGLGFEGSYFATPTAVFASLDPKGSEDPPATYLVRAEPSDVNAERITELSEVLYGVHDGSLLPSEARVRVREILAAPDRYGLFVTLGSVAIASACAARFFGGGLREIAAAGCIGFVVGAMVFLAARYVQLRRLTDLVSGLIAASGAALIATHLWEAQPEIVMLAGIIALVPGLSLTVAMSELATRNLVAGGARLLGAITVLVAIGFGAAVGQRIADVCALTGSHEVVALAWWTEPLCVLIAVGALAVLFRVPPRFVALTAAIGVAGYAGARAGAIAMDGPVGVSLGALVVGVCGNLFSRVMRKPVAVVVMPGILVLVPGAIGYRSLASFMEADMVAGVQGAFTALMVAVSLVMGLLVANAGVPARSAL